MIHPHTETRLSGEAIGHGVFATAPIPAGTLVYVKDSLEIQVSPSDYVASSAAMREIIERYSYLEPTGTRVLSWDSAKYVNHSCQPNTMSAAWGLEIAIRDIGVGEEITDEYGMFNLEATMDCACGQPRCRGIIRAADMDSHHSEWDQMVRAALDSALHVDQPLLEYLEESNARELQDYLSGCAPYRSVRTLRNSNKNGAPPRRRQQAVAF